MLAPTPATKQKRRRLQRAMPTIGECRVSAAACPSITPEIEYSIGGDTTNYFIAVSQMRSYTYLSFATNTHSYHALREPRDYLSTSG